MKRKLLKKITSGALLLVVVLLTSYLLQNILGDTYIYDAFQANYMLGVFLLVVAKIATIVLAPLSGGVLYILAGTLLPYEESILWLSVGNFIGVTLAFYLGRYYGDRVLFWFSGKKGVEKSHDLLDRLHEWKSFLVVRVGLFFLEDILNFIAGMSRLAYLPFIIISMVATTVMMLFIIHGSLIAFKYVHMFL